MEYKRIALYIVLMIAIIFIVLVGIAKTIGLLFDLFLYKEIMRS